LKIKDNGWGSSIEIFFKARTAGLRIIEVPVYCNYKYYSKAAKRDPLKQGISIVFSIISHAICERVRQ
jgi:hypothetical protein